MILLPTKHHLKNNDSVSGICSDVDVRDPLKFHFSELRIVFLIIFDAEKSVFISPSSSCSLSFINPTSFTSLRETLSHSFLNLGCENSTPYISS